MRTVTLQKLKSQLALKTTMALDQEPEIQYKEIHEIVVPHLGHVPIAKGDFHSLPKHAQSFIAYYVDYMKPRGVYICDGSQAEANEIIHKLEERGSMEQLSKLDNCYLVRTDPADVARVESKTWICTKEKHATVPRAKPDAKGGLGRWISPADCQKELDDRFPGCMAGRMMYVIPFSMGPIGSPLSKIGIQLTDSNYVVLCMRVMTRVSPKVWGALGNDAFVKCIHSVGCPRPMKRKAINHWPCNPEKIFICHFPEERKVKSFGSGYGGNSLLGKKCFALRIANAIARDEGWMAEHMLIMGITNNATGKEHYVAAAFPSACGKTNLAMLEPSIPGFTVKVVGDDIAWMRFNEKGELRAINPEAGFFGVAPGTNWKTNPNAMASFQKNSIFTNVGRTVDGNYFWEGLEDDVDPNTEIINWLGEKWKIGMPGKASHPNARFTAPASQCPIIHPKWEDPEGVKIDAILFGGRRPDGVPLVVESFDWNHGVFLGACCKSETTAAAEFKGKSIMHDPFAMRPFMGYNFGKYMQHWLDFNKKPGLTMPKIFHVNWFRTDSNGKFLWPGFGDNIRVLNWICQRCDGEDVAIDTPIGKIPKTGSIDLSGIENKTNWRELFSIPKKYWMEDMEESRKYLNTEVGEDLPKEILNEMDKQEKRVRDMQ